MVFFEESDRAFSVQGEPFSIQGVLVRGKNEYWDLPRQFTLKKSGKELWSTKFMVRTDNGKVQYCEMVSENEFQIPDEYYDGPAVRLTGVEKYWTDRNGNQRTTFDVVSLDISEEEDY